MRYMNWSVLSLVVVMAAGCSSKDDDPEPTPVTPGGNQPGGYTPEPNGVRIGEHEACELLQNAILDSAEDIGCAITMQPCDQYIQASGAPECSQYDEGSITGCVGFYGTFTSCSDFANRPCNINYYPGSAPAGCAEDDAGTDAGEPDAESDGGEPDAEPDAEEPDADTDAGELDAADTDAEVDSGDVDAGEPDADTDAADVDAGAQDASAE